MEADSELSQRMSIINEADVKSNYMLLSYNLFLRPPGISSDKLGDLKNERLNYLVSEVLPNYDIVCLQEVFTKLNSRRARLIEAATDLGFKYFSVPPEPPICSLFLVNSGLLTLSKHRIVVSDFIPFHAGSGVDGVAYKGVLYSRILVDNEHPLNLFNVHLQAHYDHEDHKNIRSRLNQISELKTFIDLLLLKYTDIARSPDFKEAIFVIGDFNVCANKNLFPKDGYLQRSETTNHFFDFIDEQHPVDHHFSEYDYLLFMLRKPLRGTTEPFAVVDCLEQSYGFHPLTFVHSIHQQLDEEALHKVSDQDSMDYIFRLVPSNQNPASVPLQAPPQAAKIQPFQVKDRLFKFASDHLGVEFKLEPKPAKQAPQ